MATEAIVDDKSSVCTRFILDRVATYTPPTPGRPFVVGLNGVQGVGKTTLVKALSTALREGAGLETLVLSIDDFYLPRAAQAALAAAHPDNALVQVRGEPGTHDVALMRAVFDKLGRSEPVRIPQYDKAAFGGRGDRAPEEHWDLVNGPGQQRLQVVIVEGWCVGFRALDVAEVEARWKGRGRTLHNHDLEHLLFVNEQLRRYDVLTDLFDAFVHIDAEHTEYVYAWRLQQEKKLRQDKGTAMTDDQVVAFVDAYYPAYEMFSDKLRSGVPAQPGRQLRLVVGRDRVVKEKKVL